MKNMSRYCQVSIDFSGDINSKKHLNMSRVCHRGIQAWFWTTTVEIIRLEDREMDAKKERRLEGEVMMH